MASFRKSLRRRLIALRQATEAMLWPPMRPTAMVLGAQKGGTTALFKYLSQHPQVVPSKQKELDFFNYDGRYARGIDFYLDYFERATPWRAGMTTIDISPDYLAGAGKAAPRIRDFDPAMRLVALLRDPVKRAFSAWQMYRKMYRRNPDWYCQFMQGRIAGDPRAAFVRRPVFGESFLDDLQFEIEQAGKGLVAEMSVLHYGHYAAQLAAFYRCFPADSLLVLESDEIRNDTVGALSRIERHFGLAPHDWSRADIAPHFEGGYREGMSDAERDLLRSYYAPHNRELFALLGREFAWT